MSVSLSLVALTGASSPATASEVIPEPAPVTHAVATGSVSGEMPNPAARKTTTDEAIVPLVPAGISLRKLAFNEIPGEARWLSNFERASSEAHRLGIPMVVHFGAAWCGPCQRMEREVLNRPELKSLFGREIIAIKIDGPSNQDLLKQFNVVAYPTDVLISTDGNVIARRQGFQSPGDYQTLLKRLAASREIQGEYGVKNGPSATEIEPVDTHQPRSLRLGANHEVIGLAGYSPVTLKKDRVWKQGDSSITTVFQGITYRFVDQAEKNEFASAPNEFIPGFHGCDPVQLIDESRPVPGRVQLGALFDDKIYFFDSEAAREMFKINPEKYANSSRVVMSDDIDETLSLNQ